MAKTSQPTVVGRGLGGELRELRTGRGLPQRRVAIRLGWQPSKLSRIENGIQGVSAADVASLLVIYGITGDERKRLLGMAERSAETGWWETIGGLSEESRTLIRLESEATSIVNWEPMLVPGLLQTPDYAQAVMVGCGVPADDSQGRVAARLGRQAILTRPNAAALRVLLDEMVLRRALGGPQVMARQLRHLIEAAERPTVTLRVVPLAVGGHTGLDGSFALFDFPRNRSVVFIDHKLTGLFLEEAPQVAHFRREADRLSEVALSPVDSVELVARYATEHERE
ncbi:MULTISPECIES: helix-turn-helix domain-containing protein [Micromonospora]|uniref:Helix-turn-helix domain-containing protein n=1 Tax=Micromonospora yangpuensis TaxID=683228 RepID=A0A1C6TZU5_9ACTN|nr:helix-turn-helix transcriptional regulator [Micromonospora yangpuensis]GGM21152.1 transcriptional regulator [Micromonospora yangpuensis]SCL47149.1 Helix-turn-helix domain-containing protein [Micromonospora yangpuensis]